MKNIQRDIFFNLTENSDMNNTQITMSTGNEVRTTMRERFRNLNSGLLRMAMVAVLLVIFGMTGFVPSAQAALDYKKGTFNKTTATGNQSVTGVGFQPKAIIFYHTGQAAEGFAAHIAAGYGFAAYDGAAYGQAAISAQVGDAQTTSTDGTGYHSAIRCIVMIADAANPAATQAEASIVSFNADGFTINWNKNAGATDIIHYVALGGTDITNAKVGTYAGPAAIGNNAVAGVGFQPDAVLFAMGNRSVALDTFTADNRASLNLGFMVGGATPSQGSIGFGVRGAQTAIGNFGSVINSTTAISNLRGSAIDYTATYVSMDADGFTINASTANTGRQLSYLALKGGNYKVGVMTQPTTGTAPFNTATTGVGFQPSGLLFASTNSASANGTIDLDTTTVTNPGASFMIGAGNAGASEGVIWGHNYNFNTNDANESTVMTAILRHASSTATIRTEADLLSLDADGFTLTYTTRSDTTARRSIYFAVGSVPPSDTTAPSVGTVTITNPAANTGTYVPAGVTFTALITEPDSTPTCNYTTNGSTWTTGVISGASSPYTCTATVTGLTAGPVTLNIQASSLGGGPTNGSSLSRTVDTAAPTTSAAPAAGTYGSDQSVTLTGDDGAGVGVSSIAYCVDTTNVCVPGTAYSGAVAVTGTPGLSVTKYLRYRATDIFGAVETTKSSQYIIDQSCTESGTVTLTALPNPITGATVVTAIVGGGASAAMVSFDNGGSWVASGSTYTPPTQSNFSLQFLAKATGSCGGEIFAAANPTTANIDTRTLGLEANAATAVQSGLTSIAVDMSYCGDKDGDAKYQVDYRIAAGTWVIGTAVVDPTNDGHFTKSITGLTSGLTYEVRMIYTDPDGILAGTATQSTSVLLVAWTDNAMLHNSNRFTGTTKHGGAWGTPGNYAGGITCATCHEKNTGNIKRIKATISYPDGSAMPGGGTSSAVALLATTGFGNDATAPRASSNKVCEACHTYDAAQINGVDRHAANQSVAAGHYDNQDCTGCHVHKAGFKADCTSCHGNPPVVDTTAANGLVNTDVTGSATSGKHDTHVNTLGYTCNTCHTGWESANEMPDQTVAARINLGFSAFGDTIATYNGRNKVNGYKATAGTTVTTTATLTCASIYCHGTATPAWTTAATVVCGSCHGTAATGAPSESAGDGDLSGAVTGTKVGKHVKHTAKYACDICHNGAGYGTAKHVDGSNDISFSGAAVGTTYDKPSSTCSSVTCHTGADYVWNTSSPALGCDSCHGYPPTSASDAANNKHAAGATPVNHDKFIAGDSSAITGNHDDCATCHGKNNAGETDNTAAGGDQYLSTYHGDGKIEMNGWATDSGQDTQYNSANWGCAKACHANAAAYQLSDSALPVQLHRYGAGGCNGCHDAGSGGAPIVSAASGHTDADGAGATYTAGTCTDCHPGGTKGIMHAKSGDANVVAIPNNTTVGISYTHLVDTGINGFVLGGDATTGTTEAQICWNCHDTNGISEWGVNNNANTGSSPYNYGTVTSSNWTAATWSSSRTQYAYKTGAIQSTHTANPSVTDAALTGAAYGYTETKNAVGEIRCSNCHDVHNLNKATGDTISGVPYLRGSWRGNPYEEDGAPRSVYANTTYFATTATFGQVPRGGVTNLYQKLGGYWIDQNNVVPMSASATAGTAALNPTAAMTVDQFGGICALCHGGGNASWTLTEVDGIDQKTGEALWMGTNGHANSVKGGTGATSTNSFNVFDARGGGTAYSNNPLQHFQGMTEPANNGTWGFRSNNSAALKYAPLLAASSTRPLMYSVDNWVVDETGATKENQYHKFSCSKCHNPHASRLPKLMITNCLDTVHNTWDNQFPMMTAASTMNNNTELAQWTSAQNCHRYSESNNTTTTSPEYKASRVAAPAGSGKGWNKVTPWKSTSTTP